MKLYGKLILTGYSPSADLYVKALTHNVTVYRDKTTQFQETVMVKRVYKCRVLI